MQAFRRLEQLLLRLDNRPYGAYRDIEGAWTDGRVELHVDRVQSDPFASPTRVRLRIPARLHGIDAALWSTAPRRVGLTNYVLRAFAKAASRLPRGPGSGKSGAVIVDAGGPELLPRAACAIGDDGTLELRFRVGLPAQGRRILGRAAARLLLDNLPRAASVLSRHTLDHRALRAWSLLAEDHAHLQGLLDERSLVCFVRDGAILPRQSGASTAPLQGAVPFESPPALRVTLPTLHCGEVTGMGLPEGVTVITGGGFHGKTTLLEAIELGVYPHEPGDGREWVVTRPDAVKVRSEDGRAITGVDVRPFIDEVPGGSDTSWFTTPDASGSTSLAAAIMEAVEVGARVLLLDEDTSATNLLVRDARMQALVRRETISPLIDRVRELSERHRLSVVLVTGGIGDYLEVADHVILMEEWLPRDATEEARRVAAEHPSGRQAQTAPRPFAVTPRGLVPASLDPHRRGRHKIRARGLRELVYGEQTIDLSAIEQLVDDSQARAIGILFRQMWKSARPGQPIRQAVEAVHATASIEGLYALDPTPELAMPRAFEVAAALNRLRSLEVTPCEDGSGGPRD